MKEFVVGKVKELNEINGSKLIWILNLLER